MFPVYPAVSKKLLTTELVGDIVAGAEMRLISFPPAFILCSSKTEENSKAAQVACRVR